MKNELETYQLIEKYLKDALNKHEKEVFEAQLKTNSNLREEVELQKMANDVIASNEAINIKNQLKDIHNSHIKKKKRKKTILFIASLIIVTTALLTYKTKAKSNTKHKQTKNISNNHTNNKASVLVQNDTNNNYSINTNNNTDNKEKANNIINIDSTITQLNITDSIKLPNTQTETPKEDSLANLSIPDPIAIIINDSNKNDSLLKDPESIIPCELIITKTDFTTVNTCKNKYKGEILFNKNTNYKYSIDGGITYKESPKFTKLAAGYYSLMIKNEQNKCISSTYECEIESYACSFIIQPNQYKYWNIPLYLFNTDEEVKLQVFSAKTAKLIYEKTYYSNETAEWKGESKNYTSLPMGNYVYILEGIKTLTKHYGEITIVK